MAVDCVGQTVDHLHQMFQFSSGHDFNLSRAVKRTGHARFRRAPAVFSDGPSTSSSQSEDDKTHKVTVTATESPSTSSSSNGKSLGIVAPAPTFSSRKPPLPSTHRKRCNTDVNRSGSVSRSGCHCCKRRKMSSSSKREIRRVPIIGSKITSIPADDYSWKKYGEKKIDGSIYPRVYYKCNTGKGCPARKRVELSLDDSKMLVVTYDGEHRHHHAPRPTPVPMSLTGVVV